MAAHEGLALTVTYRVHGDISDLRKKAESIAVGLTVGSWTDLPESRKKEMEKHRGRVADIRVLPPAADGSPVAEIEIAYPVINFTPTIPAILTCVFGKLSMDGRIKLMDIAFPDDYRKAFPGPRFGIDGVRDKLGVHDRPLLMSIFKTCTGLSPKQLAERAEEQALGGVDLIKEDEIFFSEDSAPFLERLDACLEALERARQKNGQNVLYAINLTGRADELFDKARAAVAAGANCFLLNVFAYGFDTLQRLVEDPAVGVPIVAHPAISGAMYPAPDYGIAARVLLGTLMRLAGADLVLFPSPYGSVAMPREDSVAVANALTVPFGGLRRAFPVPSAGIHPGHVPLIWRDFGRDVVINAGGGIHGHPRGATAGGQAFRVAIAAMCEGVSLREAAERHEVLREALDLWGIP
jgi:2,3-diketo-5-methylthiopentyl-1-phosphate enolase